MATFTGTKGKVTIPTAAAAFASGTGTVPAQSALAQITRWELTVRRDIHPDDTFDSTLGGKTKLGGMYDGVFTLEGFMPASKTLSLTNFQNVDQPPTAACQLDMDSAGQGFDFSGIFSDFTMSTPKNGLVTFRATGETSGEIVERTA